MLWVSFSEALYSNCGFMEILNSILSVISLRPKVGLSLDVGFCYENADRTSVSYSSRRRKFCDVIPWC